MKSRLLLSSWVSASRPRSVAGKFNPFSGRLQALRPRAQDANDSTGFLQTIDDAAQFTIIQEDRITLGQTTEYLRRLAHRLMPMVRSRGRWPRRQKQFVTLEQTLAGWSCPDIAGAHLRTAEISQYPCRPAGLRLGDSQVRIMAAQTSEVVGAVYAHDIGAVAQQCRQQVRGAGRFTRESDDDTGISQSLPPWTEQFIRIGLQKPLAAKKARWRG